MFSKVEYYDTKTKNNRILFSALLNAKNNYLRGENDMKRFGIIKQIAIGYKEMGAINLAISHADFKYENEAMIKLGDVYNEMVTEDTEGNAESDRFYFG
jgi:hypothetical protein